MARVHAAEHVAFGSDEVKRYVCTCVTASFKKNILRSMSLRKESSTITQRCTYWDKGPLFHVFIYSGCKVDRSIFGCVDFHCHSGTGCSGMTCSLFTIC